MTRQTLRTGRTAPPISLRYLCDLLFEIRILDYWLLFEHLLQETGCCPDECRPEKYEIHEKGTGARGDGVGVLGRDLMMG